MIRLLLVLLLSTVFLPGKSKANFITGNDFYEYCDFKSAPENSLKTSYYVMGVVDTAKTKILGSGLISICFPSKASIVQMRDVVCKYIRDNTEHRDVQASVLITLALQHAFPCKQK